MSNHKRTAKRRKAVPRTHRLLRGSKQPALLNAKRVGRANPKARIRLLLTVRRKPGHPAMPTQEYWAKTPLAKRVYLSREEFARLYGADAKDIETVKSFAKAQGLKIDRIDVPGRTVRLSGSIGQIEKVFRVRMYMYKSEAQKYRSHEGFVFLPIALIGVVTGVFGFDNRQLMRRQIQMIPLDKWVQIFPRLILPLTPPQVAGMYNFPPGGAEGQTIGLVEFGPQGYAQSDIDSFFQEVELPAPTIVNVPADGDTVLEGGECVLDIDVAGSAAPGATLAIYFSGGASDDPAVIQLYKNAVHDAVNNPSVISISYAGAESSYSPATLAAIHETFEEAALLGVTILAASGDNGACDNGAVNAYFAHVPTAQYPASDPYVTGCGGTSITRNFQLKAEAVFTENTWNDKRWDLNTWIIDGFGPSFQGTFVGGATGGGLSGSFEQPPWQSGIGVGPAGSLGVRLPKYGRGVPDISGNASMTSGYQLFYFGAPTLIYGTSAVAPLYAGLVALMNARLPKNVGFLNPLLYGFKARRTAFRDIADGISNAVPYCLNHNLVSGVLPDLGLSKGYKSGPLWDPCTGLGVVNGEALLESILNQ